jgi:glutathione peroxidase
MRSAPGRLLAQDTTRRNARPMSVYDTDIAGLDGGPTPSLSEQKGKLTLMVNVASKCGLTPQYTGLEELHERYADRGFAVLGFPCNQFGEQEPGSPDEIATFCSTTYGVTFPMFEKIEVNGDGRHPLYQTLTQTPDQEGKAGDVAWNFEKFLVSADGEVVARFRPLVAPDDPAIIEAIEANLPA